MDALKYLKGSEVNRCAMCGRKHWAYWHIKIGDLTPRMRFCAPCYFKHGKKDKP